MIIINTLYLGKGDLRLLGATHELASFADVSLPFFVCSFSGIPVVFDKPNIFPPLSHRDPKRLRKRN